MVLLIPVAPWWQEVLPEQEVLGRSSQFSQACRLLSLSNSRRRSGRRQLSTPHAWPRLGPPTIATAPSLSSFDLLTAGYGAALLAGNTFTIDWAISDTFSIT